MTAQPSNLSGLDLRAEINRLRKDRKAVILAHYYQKPEIQDLADFVGDSLELSRKAAATDAEVIAFCGVKFMAETAKILSPEKIVVLPDMDAGCSLEDSCPPEKFKAFREAHPDHIALTYINCSTEVKALSDVIVTSSSAETILAQISPEQKIIFGPDRHLGGYLNRKFGREMLLWPGVCIVHEAFSETELLKLMAQHPGAPVAAHPECPPHIVDHADSGDDAVEGEDQVEDQDLADGARHGGFDDPVDGLVLLVRRHLVVNLARRLVDQEEAAGDQDQVAPRDAMAQHREQRRGELHDVGDTAQQAEPQDDRQPDAGAPCPRALMLRQLVGQDGNEDQVVDAQHDFHDHQGRQSQPGIRVVQEQQYFVQHCPYHRSRQPFTESPFLSPADALTGRT